MTDKNGSQPKPFLSKTENLVDAREIWFCLLNYGWGNWSKQNFCFFLSLSLRRFKKRQKHWYSKFHAIFNIMFIFLCVWMIDKIFFVDLYRKFTLLQNLQYIQVAKNMSRKKNYVYEKHLQKIEKYVCWMNEWVKWYGVTKQQNLPM